jgi:hypothetical protein
VLTLGRFAAGGARFIKGKVTIVGFEELREGDCGGGHWDGGSSLNVEAGMGAALSHKSLSASQECSFRELRTFHLGW